MPVPPPDLHPTVADLVARSHDANAALLRGDLATYLALTPLSDDYTLFSPFGGTPTRRADLTPARLEALGAFFLDGRLRTDVVEVHASSDLVVLAVIERAHVAVGGLKAQPWALRVTMTYRRDGRGGPWRLAHRHADPLGGGISLAAAAALGRG